MKKIVITAGIVLVLAGGLFAFSSYDRSNKRGGPAQPTPQRMTLSGEYLCLPHKDTSGPQTLECAFGLRTDAGVYYALDFNLMSQAVPDLKIGEWITASGVVTPIEYLSTDRWDIYPIVGIFSVTDSLI